MKPVSELKDPDKPYTSILLQVWEKSDEKFRVLRIEDVIITLIGVCGLLRHEALIKYAKPK